ncbi:MAG: zinc ribbon domain-containing protein [Armatimonadota bacterium]|nr:zinc ribbon domain-containing protein [Armatimonadota bacterium]MDR7563459.1 zinc ribbon domain-containing protein [Armatimonadota bacterium]MDR7568688.1 zinc ribbon domain-containing protein [Armatimonadota bacterium]MDR7602838.1 zinc ribbon domain-containing protein [Armatimonadota bacterium]
MPVYEYVCGTCGQRFEELVLGGTQGSVACASCGSEDVRRVVSVFAVGRAEGKGEPAFCGPHCCRLRSAPEA